MNPLTISPAHLKRLRALCLALPGTTEKEAWGDPTWRVRDKMFAMQKGNYSGGRPSLWVKAAPGEPAFMVEAEPARFFIPPYLGHRGWVGVYLDSSADWDELARLVAASFALIAGPRTASLARGARGASAPRVGTRRRGAAARKPASPPTARSSRRA